MVSSFKIAALSAIATAFGAAQFVKRDRKRDHNHRASASEQRWEMLVQHSSSGVIVLDQKGNVTFVSDAMERILGHPVESYLGHTLEWICNSIDWPTANEKVLTMLADGSQSVDFEMRAFDADIETHIFSIVATDMSKLDGDDRTLLNITEVTSSRLIESRFHHAANNDPLTLLPNRAAFISEVDSVLRRSSVNGENVAVAVINIDDFRLINDGYGTELGDRLLVELALRIRLSISENDTVARLGGDEFSVLLASGCSEEQARRSLEKILAALTRPLLIDGQSISIRATIGLAIDNDADVSATTMIRHASTALDSAKAEKRGQLVIFNDEMGAIVHERVKLRHLLRAALDQEQLRLVYQPIVDMETGEIVSLEALARWTDPKRGPISPATFIPIAEKANMIDELGNWALRTACKQLKAWEDAGLTGFSMTVNTSGQQLLRHDFIEGVSNIINSVGVPAERITIEITESVLIDDTDIISSRIREIRKLGIGLAIDDFGTGFSSLSYLRRYEFDILKIDRSFVVPLIDEGNKRDREIVKSMIALSQSLNAVTVAEGIEHPEELAALKSLGCDRAQGFLFWKPIEADDVPAAINTPPDALAA